MSPFIECGTCGKRYAYGPPMMQWKTVGNRLEEVSPEPLWLRNCRCRPNPVVGTEEAP